MNFKNVPDVPNSVSKHSHLEDSTAVKKLCLRYYDGKQVIVDFAFLVVVYILNSVCCEHGFITSSEEPVI